MASNIIEKLNPGTQVLESDDIISLTLAAHWPLKQTLAIMADPQADQSDRRQAFLIFAEQWQEHSESEHLSLYMHMHECPVTRRQALEIEEERKHIDQWLKDIQADNEVMRSKEIFDRDVLPFVNFVRVHLLGLEDQILPKYFAATEKRERVLMGLLYLEARSLFENSGHHITVEIPRAQRGSDENSGLPH